MIQNEQNGERGRVDNNNINNDNNYNNKEKVKEIKKHHRRIYAQVQPAKSETALSWGIFLQRPYRLADAAKYAPCAVQSQPAAKPPITAPTMAAPHVTEGIC